MCRKGPPSLDLSDDFDQQTALFERIVKKAGGEPLTLASFVDAVVAMEHLEFNAWLSHVFPIRCAPAAPPAVQADAVANPFTSIALARVAATRIRK